jgi:uncharacterized OB-fold protein
MPYLKDERPETISVEGEWNIGAYKYKANRLLEEFVQGLKQKKLIGSLCPGCGKVIVPHRNICGRCHLRMDRRMTVSDKGTITCFVISQPITKGKFTIFGVDPVETGVIEEGEVVIPVFVQFDGSDSNVATVVKGVDAKDVYVGMRVRAVWAKEPQGALSDFEGVEPIER